MALRGLDDFELDDTKLLGCNKLVTSTSTADHATSGHASYPALLIGDVLIRNAVECDSASSSFAVAFLSPDS